MGWQDDEAKKLTRLSIKDDGVAILYDGWEFMRIPKKRFEGHSVREYE